MGEGTPSTSGHTDPGPQMEGKGPSSGPETHTVQAWGEQPGSDLSGPFLASHVSESTHSRRYLWMPFANSDTRGQQGSEETASVHTSSFPRVWPVTLSTPTAF